MSNFDDYNRRIQQHDRFHTWHVRNLRTVHHEISCIICYPPEDAESFPSLDSYIHFERFWDWISEEYLAESYTSYTQQYFRRLCQNLDRYRTILSNSEDSQSSDDSDNEDYHFDLLFRDMAAQAVDIQNLTAAVTALNNAFGAPN